MKIIETDLPGCLILEPQVFGDARGFFYESFNRDKLSGIGLEVDFAQGNVSSSTRGVLRGLHYQWPRPQGKLVSVLEGEVWDVAVDIRRGSPDYGRWTAAVLSAENKRHFWIPEGFAHGFVVAPISLWLIWRKRAELSDYQPKPSWLILPLLACAAAAVSRPVNAGCESALS